MPLFLLGILLTDFLIHSSLLFVPSGVGYETAGVVPLDIKLGNAGLIEKDGPFREFYNIGSGQWRKVLGELFANILVVDVVTHTYKLLIFITDCQYHGSDG
jgi:hypothetical protein